MATLYIRAMQRRFKRGDRVKIKGGRYDGSLGTVDSVVFQRTADHLGEFHHGYHVILGCGQVVTVRNDQVG